MKKSLLTLLYLTIFGSTVFGQQKGLIISEFYTNPSGNDSPYEYVELVATTSINFATTPYTVVFTDNGTATSNGWKIGGAISYAFQISTGSVTAGQVVYVGGSSMAPLSNGGISLRQINTGTTNGDSFGTSASGGVLGQGGSNGDGIAVFNVAAASITSSTVPVDAIFFGSSMGTAVAGSGIGYQLPVNDKYTGGKLVSGSFLAPDPASGDIIKASGGIYDPATQTFTTARTWITTTTTTYNTSSVGVTIPKGLIISEFLTNPSGNDSPFEYVELVATTSINFATTPYTVVFTDNGTATTNGWKVGGAVSYGFQISSGSVTAGQVVYVGGSSMAPISNSGIVLRQINTGTTAGDGFGSSASAGVLGQGGANCDGIAVFNLSASAIASTTIPVDAIFFGTGYGTAIPGTNQGYQMPINDRYNGGKLISTSYLAPDPASDQLVKATTGTYNPTSQTFTTARTWSITSTPSYNSTSVSVNGVGNSAPTITFNSTASKLVDEASGKISCVINNVTDPVIVNGLDITISDEDLTTVTFQMTSSNTSVVPNTNLVVTGSGTARKCKITPTGVGYTTITLKVIDAGGLYSQISFDLAASASIVTAASNDIYHTGTCDGSTAIPIDANYMFVGDDENNVIRLYNRNASGLAIYSFDVSPYLALSGLEVDIEASFRSPTNPNRIYWMGSLSNSKTGDPRPDRNRIFATDIVGTGANATLTFVGYYSNLRSKLISWGDSYGYNFTAKAATGIEPKRIDGFNIEGMEIGPDGTTLYIGFRAPYVGAGTNKAVIAPLLNFESWFGTGNPSTNPTFGAPIELNLNNHGIRSLGKNATNGYLIVAGSYTATGTFGLFSWDGLSTSTPVELNIDLTNLAPEGIVDVPASINGAFQVQLMSDIGGSFIPYNDAIVDKDLTEANYKKFLSSTLFVSGVKSAIIASASIDNLEKETSVTIYPNPTNTFVYIDYGNETPLTNSYKIYNTVGALVKEIKTDSLDSKIKLDLSNLETGYYFIHIEGGLNTFKINKQ